MNKSASQKFLESFVTRLKERNRLPKRIELTSLGTTTIANSFDDAKDFTISEYVFTGMSLDPATATLKSIVEKIEREAYANGAKNNHSSCLTERSDGFAAYPVGIHGVDEVAQAKANAWHEAFERFTWASWWDDDSIAFQKIPCSKESTSKAAWSLIQNLSKITPVKNIFQVVPQTDHENVQTIIVFAELDGGGFISGGAAGKTTDRAVTLYRALSELVRHGLAVHHFKQKGTAPKSFYEKRLYFFAFDECGQKLLNKRLSKTGQTLLKIPPLIVNEAIPHDLNDLVYVHRCYFESQPPFIGGDLERFCL